MGFNLRLSLNRLGHIHGCGHHLSRGFGVCSIRGLAKTWAISYGQQSEWTQDQTTTLNLYANSQFLIVYTCMSVSNCNT